MQAKLKHIVTDRINALADSGASIHDPAKRTDIIDLYTLGSILLHAKTILFPPEQAMVFAELSHKYADSLDYALPFDQVLIEFIEPVTVRNRQLLGIALSQDTFDAEEFRRFAQENGMIVNDRGELPSGTELHMAIGIYDNRTCRIMWRVDNRQMIFDHATTEAAVIKNLAIACVGYINCENITLEKHAADAKINRKRATKSKRLIEDYYLCKIRGVQYEPEQGEGTGRHVGFRFDVRGHFRRLQSGRTIWVKAHQRGVQHELYRPKVYQVD
jgi:hypothetical protein